MKQPGLCAIITSACALNVASPVVAAADEKNRFDTAGFLQSCTGHVPDVGFAVPMDTQCISQAVRMCNMSFEMRGLQRCVEGAAIWMEADGARIASQIPGFDNSVLEGKGPTALSLPMPGLANAPDCTTLSDPNLPADTACRYSEALSDWLKLRVLQRSDDTAEGEAE
jgi:hypothetical protein